MVERNSNGNENITDNKRPIVLAISTITILLIVITGLFVYIFTDEYISKVVLINFVVFVLILGLAMIAFIEYQRCKLIRNKEQRWIHNPVNVERQRPKPSAPPLSQRSSWALIPRKWSTGTALPAYTAAPTSPPSNS